MASIRKLKKDVDYLVNEIVSDCYACLVINSTVNKLAVYEIIEEAVDLRNSLYERINNPAEKHNPGLVKKHYYLVRENMFEGVEGLFAKLSEVCKSTK